MVIWFNNQKARSFMLKNGFVYTLRPQLRKISGQEVLMYGDLGKKGVVYTMFISELKSDEELRSVCPFSGFSTIEEWREAAKDSKFLYYVSILRLEEEKENIKSA